MIKVNFIKRKIASLYLSPPSSGTVSFFLEKLNNAGIQSLFLKKFLFIFFLGGAASYGLDAYKSKKMSELDSALSQEKEMNTKLKISFEEYKKYDEMKKMIDIDEASIKKKLETIKFLISNRSEIQKVLLDLSKSTPENLWLSSFELNPVNLSLKGVSYDFALISDFMKNLKEIPYFSSVELIDTKQSSFGGERDIAEFDLKVLKKSI